MKPRICRFALVARRHCEAPKPLTVVLCASLAKKDHRTAMTCLFVALFALLVCSCANVEYTAYSGRQQDWPVASGSFVQRKYDVPLYLGPPHRPYRVVGSIEVQAPIGIFETGYSETLRPAAREAARHGADAIVVLERGTNVTGEISTSSAFANARVVGNTASGSAFGVGTTAATRQAHARVLAIKFL